MSNIWYSFQEKKTEESGPERQCKALELVSPALIPDTTFGLFLEYRARIQLML